MSCHLGTVVRGDEVGMLSRGSSNLDDIIRTSPDGLRCKSITKPSNVEKEPSLGAGPRSI